MISPESENELEGAPILVAGIEHGKVPIGCHDMIRGVRLDAGGPSMTYQFNRRGFLQLSAAGVAGLALSRRGTAATDSNGKLRLAAIGTGRKGRDDLEQISKSPRVEVVALCNVDDSQLHLGWAVEAFPKAATFSDYRKLLDTASTFDAVSVSTPDHMHAPIALAAMSLGKHCYCQKPLTHTVHEARLMRDTAKTGVNKSTSIPSVW